LSIHLENTDLVNTQQMEVAVNGPDGATHLILCTGVANLEISGNGSYTFLVGPQLSRRQFVGVIASGAWSQIQNRANMAKVDHGETPLEAYLLTISGSYDDHHERVRVIADISLGTGMTKVAISYQVSILAELPAYLRTK
jgi:hypothetical protein